VVASHCAKAPSNPSFDRESAVRRGHEAAGVAALALVLLAPCAVSAQVIMGRVEADSVPMELVEVVLADSLGEEVHELTDANGLFRFDLPGPGVYTLRARHSDYAPAGPESVTVGADEEVAVVVRLETPIPLMPIEVTARRRLTRSAVLASLQERLAWAEKTGLGHVIRRDEIERLPASDVRDLLRSEPRIHVQPLPAGHTQRVWIRNGTGECMPQVYVDGVRDVSRQGVLDMLSTFDLEAVEIYRSALEAPPEYIDPSACGVILFWTRRDATGGKPLGWKRVLALVSVVGFMLITLKR
jgi:hypothetical protein